MITLAEVFDAIEKNGLPKGKYNFFKYDIDHNIIAACALGQASINLNDGAGWSMSYYANRLNRALNNIPVVLDGHTPVGNHIAQQNDLTNKTLKEIADNARIKYAAYLDIEVNV